MNNNGSEKFFCIYVSNKGSNLLISSSMTSRNHNLEKKIKTNLISTGNDPIYINKEIIHIDIDYFSEFEIKKNIFNEKELSIFNSNISKNKLKTISK